MKKVAFALFVILITSGIANATTEVLTFGGLQNGEEVLNYFNGGTGSDGSAGPNYGIVFSPNTFVGLSLAAGGTFQNFNQPSGSFTSIGFFSGNGDIMDVAAGFTTGFSFYKSGPVGGTVNVYSGLDCTGTLLASLTFAATPQGSTDGGLLGGYYSVWDPIGMTFSGIAESVDFSGTADETIFDDITLGSPNTCYDPVPEPSTIALLGLGFAVLGFARRKTKN